MYAPDYQRPLVVSPSSLKEAKSCFRRWADAYVAGNRDQDPRANLLFGSIVHCHLEGWAKGGSLYNPVFPSNLLNDRDKLIAILTRTKGAPAARAEVAGLFRDAPAVALTALRHLPPRQPGIEMLPEHPVRLDVARYHQFAGPAWGISPKSSRDLVVVYPAQALRVLYDYKTTSDFKWALDQAQLREDIQWLTYALATLDEMPYQTRVNGIWIYMRSKGTPASQITEVSAGRDELVAGLVPWFELADRCIGHMAEANLGRKFDLADYPAADTTTPCNAYGKQCHLSRAAGGPCAGPDKPSPFGWARAQFERDHKQHLPVIQTPGENMNAPAQPYTPSAVPPTPAVVAVNLANRLQEATGSLPFRPTEVDTHMAPAAPAAPEPVYYATHPGDGKQYQIFGVPGVLARYSNGYAVTDANGRYKDVLGNYVTDPPAPAAQAPAAPESPASPPQAPAAPAATESPASPPASPAPVATSISPAVAQASAAPYTPPPAETPPPAKAPKGKPRKVAGDTDESYATKVTAWEAKRTGAAPVTPATPVGPVSLFGEAAVALAVRTEPARVGLPLDELLADLAALRAKFDCAGYKLESKLVL